MKRLIIIILACLVMASTLLIISLKFANSEKVSVSELISASEQKMQSQINDLCGKINVLSVKISVLNDNVSQIQIQSPPKEIGSLTMDTINLTTKVNSLQTQVKDLQDKLKGAETIIGAVPITLNGLSIIFITNDINIGMTGSTNPSVAQFAIKIVNTTNSALTNIDITGTIKSSQYYPDDVLASGYPQLSDGAGLCNYVYFIKNGELHFEAFSNAKTSLSIPAGSSITLRPKISMLTIANEKLPDTIFKIALDTITYDRAATK
jgi:hypothetical protein